MLELRRLGEVMKKTYCMELGPLQVKSNLTKLNNSMLGKYIVEAYMKYAKVQVRSYITKVKG